MTPDRLLRLLLAASLGLLGLAVAVVLGAAKGDDWR